MERVELSAGELAGVIAGSMLGPPILFMIVAFILSLIGIAVIPQLWQQQ